MERNSVACVFFVLLMCPVLGANDIPLESINGGKTCAACTVVVALVEQMAVLHNVTVSHTVGTLCSYLPGHYGSACRVVIDVFGPIVIDLLTKRETPDVICHTINFCSQTPNYPKCHLFPLPQEGIEERIHISGKLYEKHKQRFGKDGFPKICTLPGVKIICRLIDRVAKEHKPSVDLDGDNFSITSTLRGSYWRGKDCNDLEKAVHPGARPFSSDLFEDTNCNGIHGVDPTTGISYEDKFCKDTESFGVAVLGDSVGAHFHIPPEWLRVKQLSWDVLKYLPVVLENEFDWPHLSTSTGFINNTWPVITGPTDSIYLRMRQRNRCNHRDYQNLGVNGARSSKMANYLVKSLSRNQTSDYPLLLFLELVGNDVCNGDPDTLAHMTTPEEMHNNTMKTLKYLNSIVPKGSHLLMMGLADGQVLYGNLKGRYHPLGEFRKDITYGSFYDWMSCLQISPCSGWLSTNKTLRNLTSERAKDLSDVLNNIAIKHRKSFPNIEVNYINCPLAEVIAEWEKLGHAGWELIEPVDGFHPNQIANALSAKFLWNYFEKKLPHYLGSKNPHNDEIIKVFGEQGGH